MLEGVSKPMEERAAGMMELFGYLQHHIEDHIANPRDDLISFLLDSELDGQKLDGFQVGRTIALLLIAGIDTTWSAIGASIWHLAKTPSDRERLVADRGLLPTAIEELLRAYAPVTMARLVKEDMEFNGCPMKAEEWVLLPFPSANRDPEMFENPNEVILDREPNRHAAFGLGVHRCAGSHLARMELQVALEVWLERFPVFELADPDAVSWSGGQVRGPASCPSASSPSRSATKRGVFQRCRRHSGRAGEVGLDAPVDVVDVTHRRLEDRAAGRQERPNLLDRRRRPPRSRAARPRSAGWPGRASTARSRRGYALVDTENRQQECGGNAGAVLARCAVEEGGETVIVSEMGEQLAVAGSHRARHLP